MHVPCNDVISKAVQIWSAVPDAPRIEADEVVCWARGWFDIAELLIRFENEVNARAAGIDEDILGGGVTACVLDEREIGVSGCEIFVVEGDFEFGTLESL